MRCALLLPLLLAAVAAWTPSSSAPPCAFRHGGVASRCGATVAQTADIACDEESCGDEQPRQKPGLTAPGEEFKQAVYTKSGDGAAPAAAEAEFAYTPRPDAAFAYPGLEDSLLEAAVGAAERAVADPDPAGQEAYGDWIREELSAACTDALAGLRGRKLVWWLDAPRPLRAVAARGLKYEVSVVALPGGCTLPAAAFPRGSVIYCAPLLGQFTVRRLRFDITGKTSTPIELMKRVLKAGTTKPTLLPGGPCHSYEGVPGVASAFLQLVMLPPTSSFPPGHVGGEGSIGWRRPPGESCAENLDVIDGVCLGVEQVGDLLLLDRPSPEALARERELDRTGGQPGSALKLTERIGQRVGGLNDALDQIVRRVLASRLYPPSLTRPLGVKPVRGMLLFGPPGCGKTLLAREIANAMGAREPKIVNGPEMMSKYVGDSEQFIRSLFAEAEVEQAEAGDDSALQVIVFDEIDAFTRERGSLSGDTSGIRDSVVNQLLAKMDGVDQLDNILVIGMTNRPELMDPALLRPGRLEVHVLVPQPDAAGRQRIAAIHSKRLRERGCLEPRAAAALSSGALADTTEGFSGADIAGLMRSATSFALERYADERLLSGWAPGAEADRGGGSAPRSDAAEGGEGGKDPRSGLLEVRYEDLVRALREVSPTGSSTTRAQGRGAFASAASRLRGWRRERRLSVRTEKASVSAGQSA